MLQKLLAFAEFRCFEEGAIILRQGERNQVVYCLLKGSVVVEMDEQTLCILQRNGDLFGEMSVLSDAPCNATVRAFEDVEAATLSVEVLKKIRENSSHELHAIFYQWLTRILMDKLTMTSEKAKHFEEANQRLKQVNQALDEAYHGLDSANQEMERDLALAADMQRACMSGKIEVPFLKTAIHYHPCGKVSGDMYYCELDQDGSFLFLGDGADGVAAAFITMMCRMGFSSIKTRRNLAEVMTRLNQLLASCVPHDKFITGVLMRITTEGEMTMTDSGQGLPLILPADGSAMVVKQLQSLPLGMFEDTDNYQQESYSLQPGDKVFLYTDGLTEHADRNGEQFGRQRVIRFLEDHRHENLTMITMSLLNAIEQFAKGNPHEDDVTLIGFEMERSPHA